MKEELEKQILNEIEKMGKREIYIDYRDFEDLEYIIGKNDTRESFIDSLYECYSESFDAEYDCAVDTLMEKFDIPEEERENVRDLVFENLCVELDYESFLNQKIKVNIITSFYNDWNSCFTTNGWLRWLMHSQGFKVNSYPVIKALAEHRYLMPIGNGSPYYYDPADKTGELVRGISKDDNKFIRSLYQEIVNMCIDESRTLVFLAKITIGDYYKLIEKKYKSITLNKSVMCGLFDYYNGGGSVLELDLEKDVKISEKNIYMIQVERVKPCRGYSVDEVYGLTGSCWKEDILKFH